MSGSAPSPYNAVWVLIPSILGGGEVIADALVLGTPEIGVSVGISVAAGEGENVSGAGVEVDSGIDVGVGGGVSTGTNGADGAAQPPSKITTIASANNDFLGLIRVPSSP